MINFSETEMITYLTRKGWQVKEQKEIVAGYQNRFTTEVFLVAIKGNETIKLNQAFEKELKVNLLSL